MLSRFSKNLNLELPLLKILGGASINDLAEEAAERLLPSAIPLVQATGPTEDVPKTAIEANGAISERSPSSDGVDLNGGTKINGNVNLNGELKLNGEPKLNGEAKLNGESKLNGEVKVNGETELNGERRFQRKVRMSLNQEHSWKLQKHAHDPTTFNSTIGMYLKGYIDLERLSLSFRTLFERHEIFRTCFPDTGDHLILPMQVIMKVPTLRFETSPVTDRAAAEQGFMDVDRERYDLAGGITLKVVDFTWAPDEHILVIAYNQLVCDGWTYERLFVELTQIYDGKELPPAPQYAEFATRQRMKYEHGRMDEDLTFWKVLHKTPLPFLPVMSLPQARSRRPPTWDQHVLKARLGSTSASRIKEASRRWKATPMQFYLAAYYVLLTRLSGENAISVGVADANRPDLDDLSTMGFFLNTLPLRLAYPLDYTFGEVLSKTKEQMRSALLHSRVPCHIILEHLGIENTTAHAPLFQAVFDYKQGQAESGSIGGAHMAGVLASRPRTSYDITLEMSDDPTKDPLITFKLQSSIYGSDDVQTVMKSYVSTLTQVSQNQGLLLRDVSLAEPKDPIN